MCLVIGDHPSQGAWRWVSPTDMYIWIRDRVKQIERGFSIQRRQ